ncbi:SurA N-terminal domain-containing protein [Desulfococcaceae bacterium HSG9]|nr:SurA N-terminal domain-containing protein [Desulfococcaceae bacterium HSG9]
MLNLMRKKAGSWLIKLILGAIVVVFVFWGVGSYSEKRRMRVAIVNGEAISVMEYNEAYNQIMDRLRQQFGNNLNDDLLKMMNIKQQALNQIIDKRVLFSEADRLNFNVDSRELADIIRNIPAFQDNGVFNQSLYTRVLTANRLTPESFERSQKDALLINKLRSFITGFVKISDREVREWYQWDRSSVKIKYISFKPNMFTDIQPSDEEIDAYYKKHQEKYKTQPQIKVRYLHFTPEAYREEVKIEDQELQEYYDVHPEEFKQPKTVEARHILIKVASDANTETVATAKAKAEEVFKKAQQEGQDFAELAKQESEGPTKDKGGYLGSFKKDAMVKPFSDKAFAMQAGEISEPVKTRFGWHIIKVEKINDASVRTFETVKSEIRGKLATSRSKSLAYDAADSFYEAADHGEDLVKTAKAAKLEVKTTDLFAQNKPPQDVKNGAQFAAAAFKLQLMNISDIQDFGDSYYVLQMIEKVPGLIPELKTVADKVKSSLIKEMQDKKASEKASAVLKNMNESDDAKTESPTMGLTLITTDFFKRNDSPKDIDRSLIAAAFKLSDTKKWPDEVVKGGQGYYIPIFVDRQAPEMKDFEKEEEKIRNRLRTQKQSKIFSSYLAQLKKNSEIMIEPEYAE